GYWRRPVDWSTAVPLQSMPSRASLAASGSGLRLVLKPSSWMMMYVGDLNPDGNHFVKDESPQWLNMDASDCLKNCWASCSSEAANAGGERSRQTSSTLPISFAGRV